MTKEKQKWEEEFDERFYWLVKYNPKMEESLYNSIKSFIRQNFVPKEKIEEVIEKAKKQVHFEGIDGNMHRISLRSDEEGYNQALSDLRRELLDKEKRL